VTTRNLDALFAPRSIALVGASNRPGSIGAVLARNLLESGFCGPVLPVNPHEISIRSALCYKTVADLPVAPDLAVIATPAPSVPGLVAELAAKGCRAAVIISAGFGEAGGAGADLRQQVLDASRPTVMRIVGPNCLGVLSPPAGVNASFAQLTPRAGDLALVTQSGAIATAAVDWAHGRGYGFSRIATLGDMADVDFGDMLDFLALDPATKGVLLYVESVTHARKFMSAARACARLKPVTVVKAGRSAAGAKAALSHTGALAGSDAVCDAAFRRAGLLRVYELRELFDAVTTLSSGMRVRGDRLAVLTNGGGAGVLAVDALDAHGGQLAELAPSTMAALDAALPAAWSKGNPVDILGDAGPERYAAALEALLGDPGVDAVLAMNCPTAVTDSAAAAAAVVKVVQARARRPAVLTAWLGDASQVKARVCLAEARLPAHETPDEAVRAFSHLAEHARNQQLLIQVPSREAHGAPDRAAARAVIDFARREGRTALTDLEAKAMLAAYGIPVLATERAATPAEAARAARAIGGLVALKILSPDISHKTDVGGVALEVSADDAEAAADDMLRRVTAAKPEARIDGFLVQPMVRRPGAHELIAGIATDPSFGPIVLFGAGGVAVEVDRDRAIGLPPLNAPLAQDMISRTRIARRLAGYRDRPAADAAAIADVLIRLSELAIDFPDLAELDINPLLADDAGVLALDARVRIGEPGVATRPAICTYPAHLTHERVVDGDALTIRAVRPEDAAGLIDLVARCDAEDARMRFHSAMSRLPKSLATRLSQLDYDREMALAAVDANGDILGVARLASDPEGEAAEFALLVRSDRQHHGLGHVLMLELIAYARTRGLRRLWGAILRTNRRMLELVKHLGFELGRDEDISLTRATLKLK
jgi:acetyltransferase